jgi:hypothetical protein
MFGKSGLMRRGESATYAVVAFCRREDCADSRSTVYYLPAGDFFAAIAACFCWAAMLALS